MGFSLHDLGFSFVDLGFSLHELEFSFVDLGFSLHDLGYSFVDLGFSLHDLKGGFGLCYCILVVCVDFEEKKESVLGLSMW